MLKNILKVNGAQQLSKNDQKSIVGGGQYECEQAGGEWRCVGTSNCGCVFDGPIGPNYK